MKKPQYYDDAAIRAALPFDRAITGIEDALAADVDPENDSPRLFSPAPDGEFLMMPTNASPMTGFKIATIAPNNPQQGLPKIQALYMLFESSSLSPVAILEGTELTAIRTPACTLAAVKNLTAADPDFPAAPQILVFGAGVQAVDHIRAAQAIYPEASFWVAGRTPARVDALIETLGEEGIEVAARDASAAAEADIILCVTSSSEPVFDGSLPQDHAVVASVGAHGLENCEVDATLLLRSDVYVEGRASAWRESGNLAQALSTQEWKQRGLANIRDVVTGNFQRELGKPALYSGVGMAWEDLVLARLVYEQPGTEL